MATRYFVTALLSATALVGASQLAAAADLPMRAAAQPVYMPVAAFNWTGFYAGIHGGYGTGKAKAFGDSMDIDGWYGGGQIGYNWQAAGSPWVLGLEVDSSFGGIDGSLSDTIGGVTGKVTSEINYLGTARVRAGYAVNNVLFYATGGLAWANNEIKASASIPGLTASTSDEQFHVGYAVGGGLEWAFAPQWSAKVEYVYLGLGGQTYFGDVGGGFNADLDAHTVKVGLNYRFF
jgi:outer membrane immunogenic protein